MALARRSAVHPRRLRPVRARSVGRRRALGRRQGRVASTSPRTSTATTSSKSPRCRRRCRAALAKEGRRIAQAIAEALDYVGVLAVEMFVVEGRRATSSCWSTRSRRAFTIPATGPSTARRCRNSSSISARSPAGRSASRCGAAEVEMTNLIGAEIDDYAKWLDAERLSAQLRQARRAAGPQDGPRHKSAA